MKFSYVISMVLLLWMVIAKAEIAVPPLSHRVTDLTATFNAEQIKTLEDKLAAFEARKGSQIAVLLLPTIEEEDIAAFGIRVAEAWKIGRKNVDDGVILIVAKDDRKLRLEVGRGLEGAIPDAIAKRVLAETIKPHFKNNDYFSGVDAGVTQVISLIDGEKLPEPSAESAGETDNFDLFVIIIFFVSVFFNLIFSTLMSYVTGTIAGAITVGITSAVLAAFFALSTGASIITGLIVYLLLKAFTGFGGGSGGNSGGSSWSSSSSDSSWSGGGGDFGGGGASDSW